MRNKKCFVRTYKNFLTVSDLQYFGTQFEIKIIYWVHLFSIRNYNKIILLYYNKIKPRFL